MKTVNDIILSDICNDETSISLFNFGGDRLTAPGRRFDNRILDWDVFEVYCVEYFPRFNCMSLFLDYPEEVDLDDC